MFPPSLFNFLFIIDKYKKENSRESFLFFFFFTKIYIFTLVELQFHQWISVLARFTRPNIKNSPANAFFSYSVLSSEENIRASYVINVLFAHVIKYDTFRFGLS